MLHSNEGSIGADAFTEMSRRATDMRQLRETEPTMRVL